MVRSEQRGQRARNRSDPGSQRGNRRRDRAGEGVLERTAVPERSPRVGSRNMVEPLILGINETIERWRGRTRGLSRSGSSEEEVRGENEWLALDGPDTLDSHPLGSPGLGLAPGDRSFATVP